MPLPRLLLRTHATAAVYAARAPSLPSRAFHASATLRAIDMSKVDTTGRLAELRKLMKERNVDIYSTKSSSSNPGGPLTHMQWFHPKTATRANTLPLATPVEVRPPAAPRCAPIDPLQHTSAALLAQPATPLSHTTRLHCQLMGATSIRPRSNSMATGSSLSRASRMSRRFKTGLRTEWKEERLLLWTPV